MRRVLSRVAEGWNQFWFEPQETSTTAVVRICFGLVGIGWCVTLLPDLNTFLSSDGLLPHAPAIPFDGAWRPLELFPGDGGVVTVFVATLIAAICLTIGLFPRLATLVFFLGVLGFMRRNPFVFNSGDGLVRIIALYLVLMPTGAALTIGRFVRARDRFWEFPRRAPWGLRLLQIQMSILYFTAVWDKVRTGPLWNDGTAMSYIQRIADVRRFWTPTFSTDSIPINVMTYGTLCFELALAVLVWNRRLRPWVLVVGIVAHLFIDYSIRVGFFSLAVVSALLSFIPAASTSRAILRIRDLVGRRGRERAVPSSVGV